MAVSTEDTPTADTTREPHAGVSPRWTRDLWPHVALPAAATALVWALGFVVLQHWLGSLRRDLLTQASTQLVGQPPDLLLKLCEAAVSRADITISVAQFALALIAAVGGLAVVRTFRTEHQLRLEHEKVMQRAEDARSRAESLAAHLRGDADVTRRNLADLISGGERSIEALVAKGESSILEMRGAATALLQQVQTAVEQRLKAVDEMARQRPAEAQPPAEAMGREALWLLAQSLLSTGQLEKGAELLTTVAQHDLATGSLDINVLNQLSGLLDRLGRYAGAAAHADLAIAHFPEDVAARFNKAVVEIHLGATAPTTPAKRDHWVTALQSFGAARTLHQTGHPLTDADYGKMWLFAGETAEYMAGVTPTREGRYEFLQRAAAWYDDGKLSLLEALRSATEQTSPALTFWANNAQERTLKLHHIDRWADSHGLQRHDIARRDNDIPFWREEDAVFLTEAH